MDALSDLLRVLRFSGGLFLEMKFRAPWCVRAQVSPQDCGPVVKAGGELAAFHYILEGRVQVRLGKERPRSAGPGSLILLAHNDSHSLGSDVTLPPMEGATLIRRAEGHELAHIDFGTGRQVRNHFVCGFLVTAMQKHPLLVALPSVLVADLRGRPCAETLNNFPVRRRAGWRRRATRRWHVRSQPCTRGQRIRGPQKR